MDLKKIVLLLSLFYFVTSVKAQDIGDLTLAEEYFKNNDYEKSLPIYKQLYQRKNGENIYYKEYLAVLLKLKMFEEAEKIIIKKIKTQPNLKIDLGQLYLEKGDITAANKIFDAIVEKLPANLFEITELANAFYNINNYDYAIKTFVYGRKLFHKEDIFTYELISLYSIKKIKPSLIEEIISLINRQPEYLQMGKNAINRTFEGPEDYGLLRTQILKKIQKDPQNTIYIDLLAWQYLQQKQFDLALIQMIALDKRTNNISDEIYAYGKLFSENKAFETSNKAFEHLIQKGKNNLYYLLAQFSLLKNRTDQVLSSTYQNEELVNLSKNYENLLLEFGKNNQTLFAIRQLANLKAFYLHQISDAQILLEQTLTINNLELKGAAEIKLELADIYLINNNRWDAALLYGQVEKSFSNEPLGQEAKFRNAKLSFFYGDFNWAKAQLDVLKASTSQFIANDALDLSLLLQDQLNFDSTGNALQIYAKSELMLFKNQPNEALIVLDSINLKYPKHHLAPEILITKSKIYIQQKEFQKAADALTEISEKYSYSIWADNALFNLATLEEQELNRPTQALKHYEELIANFPGSLFVIETRKRFRNLRGDRQ